MSLPRRIILSLLISILLFAVFMVVVFTGLFDVVEARFYNPRVVERLERNLREDARAIDALMIDLRDRFTGSLAGEAVRRSFLPNQEREDILERARVYGELLNSVPGLRTVRFVDAGGLRLHFSTLAGDVLRQDESSLSYRGYRDCPDVLPYGDVETLERESPRFIFDGPGERLIFSSPFTDSMDVYRGSALFTFSVRALADYLAGEGRMEMGEDISVVSSPGGFLFGLPATGKGGLKDAAALLWDEGILNLTVLDQEEGQSLALLSVRSAGGFFVGRMARERLFTFPGAMKFLLLICFFLTVFLFSFLLCSLRQDRETVIRNRLKGLQSSLIRQYYETKGDLDWRYWSRELEQRRKEVRDELQRGLPRVKDTALQSDLDALFDRSWDELIAATGGRRAGEFDKEQLRFLVTEALRQVLATGPGGIPVPPGSPAEAASVPARPLPAPSFPAAGMTGGITGEGAGEPEEPFELEDLAAAEDEPEELEPLEEAEPVEELPAAEIAGTETEAAERPETGMDNDAAEAEPLEELEALELEELDGAEEGPGQDAAPGEGTVVTPAAFERGEPEEEEPLELEPVELEPLEELPPDPPPEAPPLDPDALASQIEFGPGAGDPEGEGRDEAPALELDMASPFDSLSFESPDFSMPGGGDTEDMPRKAEPESDGDGGLGKKKRDDRREPDETGLEEITGDGGLPFIYQPFLFRGNEKPLPLRPLAEPGESIREQDGIPLVNREILDPNQESDRALDPAFLRLIESITGNRIPQPKGG
jgi:hypothetical protein